MESQFGRIWLRPFAFACLLSATGVFSAVPVMAEWPNWRGPSANGSISTGSYPTNLARVTWKFALPGKGGSTPILSGNRIFLTTPDDGRGCRPGSGSGRQTSLAHPAGATKRAQTPDAGFELQCLSGYGWQRHFRLLSQFPAGGA
jgi:hypothetical protein